MSLTLANWGNRNDVLLAFYSLPTRIWELMAGSILAYYEITKGRRNEHKILNLILPSIGLILITHSIFFLMAISLMLYIIFCLQSLVFA